MPQAGGVRRAAVVGPVAIGWFFGVGALFGALHPPVWIMASVSIELTIGVGLASLVLAKSTAMAAWLTATVATLTGWLAYVSLAGPWTWTGEVSLILPAGILTMLWPVARAHEAAARLMAGGRA